MHNHMNNLAHTIRQLQSGTLERTEFFVQLDRILSSEPADAGPMLETLSEEHARSPLPPDVYMEVKRRIAHLREARQRLGADETYVQTKPGPYPALSPATPAGPDMQPGPPPERMKGVGDTLNGRFVLEECVGFGMGTVYKALDLRKLEASDRQPYIAIKVLNVQFQGHPKSLIALQREARKAQKLAHPNIVSVYDFDRDGSMVYLTMEYLDGKPLSQVLRAPDFNGMPYADAMRIVRGMGLALAYAHERGFVHCDFKPANVILTDAGQVKVIDFGIARVFHKAEEDVDVTVFDPGSLGALTPAYASPEMIEHGEPDPRDDIYALGCITYELLTGRHPFNRMSATQARAAGMRPQRPPQLGHAQWRGLKCALAFERERRTPTVARFLEELGEHRRLPRPMVLAGAGLLAALLAAGIVRYFWPGPQDEQPSASAPPAPAIVTPAGPEPGTSAPAAPRPSPPLALASVMPLLSGLPCSALVASVQGHLVRVQGYLSKSYGRTRLNDMLAILPGVSAVELDVQELSDDKCQVLGVLGRYWTAHRLAGGGAAIRLKQPGATAELREGDALMVDITSPGYESYVTVDYFVLDGSVVHLLPSLRARDNLAPARYTATIGSLGDWVIGKPFGTEMVVLLATPVQLFDSLRPETEPAADYLRALERQLTLISSRHGPDKIAVDFVQIATRAKRR
jgi:hypothetical protein